MLENKKKGGSLLHSGAGEAARGGAQMLLRPGRAALLGSCTPSFLTSAVSSAPTRGSESLPCLS